MIGTTMRRLGWRAALATATAFGCIGARVETASACGGLFCSGGGPQTTTNTAFVNQTAERIVFVDNPDGTITAVIQIVYEGPADRFAWILPVAGIPVVKVSSNLVLDALQQQTNPQYSVTTLQQFCSQPSFGGPSGGCACGNCAGFGASAPSGAAGGGGGSTFDELGGPAVVVEAAGTIGPYDFTVLSVNPLAVDPAAVAIEWLTMNEFDVGELGPDVLRPYLQDGLNLLAFRLNKDADVGSIRPVMLTYPAEQASIPIIPTAVAANEDMGVLVWIAAETRAVPITYQSIVLNEALIDWFNPGDNYAAVVTEAANEAGGRAFVTEFAGALALPVLVDDAQWNAFTPHTFAEWREMVRFANNAWGTWDGFDEALARAVSLPEGTAFAEFKRCLPALDDAAAEGLEDCAALVGVFGTAQVDRQEFHEQMSALVIAPVADTLALLSARPYLTRLFTTLSPDEMIVDPVFALNAELGDVGNLHVVSRNIPCFTTLGSMTLPQGATVFTDSTDNAWPVDLDQLPAALQVIQHGTSGAGNVLIDESASVAGASFGVASCHTGVSGAGGDGVTTSPRGSSPASGTAGSRAIDARSELNTEDGDGCSAAGGNGSSGSLLALLGIAWLANRRRRAFNAARP